VSDPKQTGHRPDPSLRTAVLTSGHVEHVAAQALLEEGHRLTLYFYRLYGKHELPAIVQPQRH